MHVPHAHRVSAKPLAPLVLGLAVAAGIYVFGVNHVPDYSGTGLFGRTAVDTLPLKSWLASVVLALAVVQLTTALWMTLVRWRGLPGWLLPLAGGFLVSGVVVLWFTSALWYFNDMHL